MALGTGTAPLLRFMLSWVFNTIGLPCSFTPGSDFTHKHAAISSFKSRRLRYSFVDVFMVSEYVFYRLARIVRSYSILLEFLVLFYLVPTSTSKFAFP